MTKHGRPPCTIIILVLLTLLVESLCIPHSEVDATTEHTTEPLKLSRTAPQSKHQNAGQGQPEKKSTGMIVTYWGQYDEGSLYDACQTFDYEIIILSFLSEFGHNKKPRMNLADHCDAESGGCKHLRKDIDSCHKMGVKILVSLGGADGGYGLESDNDAETTALHIWNSYLGGKSSGDARPFGAAVLDGVDFDMEKGKPKLYAKLATSLKSLMDKSSQKFILSAAPQCPFEDEFMGPGEGTSLGTGVFDYVWVQFYNNEQCHYNHARKDPSRVLKSWKKWTSALPNSKIFLGLPASLDASTDSDDKNAGFMPLVVLIEDVLPVIKESPNYGGVMLWSYFYDQRSDHGKNQVFSRAIRQSV